MNLRCFALLITLSTCSGCSQPVASPPPAIPEIMNEDLAVNAFADNQAQVTIHNKGEGGWVKIEVRGVLVTTKLERSETGVEESLREMFTTKNAPPPRQSQDYQSHGKWTKEVYLKKNETQEVLVELPGFSIWDGVQLFIDAQAIWRPSD